MFGLGLDAGIRAHQQIGHPPHNSRPQMVAHLPPKKRQARKPASVFICNNATIVSMRTTQEGWLPHALLQLRECWCSCSWDLEGLEIIDQVPDLQVIGCIVSVLIRAFSNFAFNLAAPHAPCAIAKNSADLFEGIPLKSSLGSHPRFQ